MCGVTMHASFRRILDREYVMRFHRIIESIIQAITSSVSNVQRGHYQGVVCTMILLVSWSAITISGQVLSLLTVGKRTCAGKPYIDT